jgi:hypothetical protein
VGVNRDALTARGQAAAEAGMVDACVIRRRSGPTTDPDTGVVTPTYTTVYTGKCKTQQAPAGGNANPSVVGEAYLLMLRLEVHLPMTVAGLDTDDEITITSSRDPDLVGRVFLIRELAHKTYATARRVGVQERTS